MSILISSLLGFFGSLVPELFKGWRDAKDREHERWVMQQQIELQKLGLSQRLEEVTVQAASEEYQALYKTWNVGVAWVDALNGTVRPILTYAFFLLYAFIKVQVILSVDPSLPWLVEKLWTEEDAMIFAGIISFYFGSRAFVRRK